MDSLQRAAFFINTSEREQTTEAFRARYADGAAAIVEAANRVLRHEFDLLGSGSVTLGPTLPWHRDFKAARDWPLQYASDIDYMELDRPTDVKVPWELSRCQHFTTLGQAYWLTGDERYAQEFVAEVEDWIAGNPWGYGVNWACAMDVALARRELDLGLPLLRWLGGVRRRRRFAERSFAPCTCTGATSPVISSGATSMAITTSATVSGLVFLGTFLAGDAERPTMAGDGQDDRC